MVVGVSQTMPPLIAELKRAAAIEAVRAEVRSGMVVGLGTGSTVRFVLDELGRQLREEDLRVSGVPTSESTTRLAQARGIPLVDLSFDVDVALDGADEVDAHGTLTKGGGGALTREKCLAQAASRLVIVVDQTKLVRRLAWPVPVEVLPMAAPLVQRTLRRRFVGSEPRLRMAGAGPFRTDNGNYILDLAFTGARPPAASLARAIKLMTGVVDHGLFVGMRPVVYVGTEHGVIRRG